MKSAVSKVILVFMCIVAGSLSAQDKPLPLQTGLGYFSSNRFSDALRSFRDVILDPSGEDQHAEAYYWIARSYLALADYDNAEKSLEFYLLHYPEHQFYAEAYYQKGRLLFLQGEYENSIRVLYDFLEKYPDHPYASNGYYWIGECLFTLGSLEDARRVFSLIPEKFPSSFKLEAAKYRISLIDLKEREEVLLDMIKMSHEEYIKMLEDFQTRERSYTQALDIYQRRLSDAATADRDGLILSLKSDVATRDRDITEQKNTILDLQSKLKVLEAQLAQTEAALASTESSLRDMPTVVPEQPAIQATPVLSGTGVEQLLELKSRLLDIREYYLDWLAAELEAGK